MYICIKIQLLLNGADVSLNFSRNVKKHLENENLELMDKNKKLLYVSHNNKWIDGR